MSLLPTATFLNAGQNYFLYNGGTTNITNQQGNISTIVSNHIQLDTVGLDCDPANGGALLINGVPVATVNNNLSSIAVWSSYPATSTINAGTGGGVVNMNSVNAATSMSTAALTISSINGIRWSGYANAVGYSGSQSMWNGQVLSIDTVGWLPGTYLLDAGDNSSAYCNYGIYCALNVSGNLATVGCGSSCLISDPPGTAPSTANMMTVQAAISPQAASIINVYFYSSRWNNSGSALTIQWTAKRIATPY